MFFSWMAHMTSEVTEWPVKDLVPSIDSLFNYCYLADDTEIF